jgi:hypothetical protein
MLKGVLRVWFSRCVKLAVFQRTILERWPTASIRFRIDGFEKSMGTEMPPLTKDKRRQACIHEAAHAIVAAIGGSFVYSVEVAPERSTNWIMQGRKGDGMTDLWGICRASDLGIARIALRWNADESGFRVDRKVLAAYMAALEQPGSGVRAEVRRSIRAYVCVSLAGPIADQIANNEPVVRKKPDYSTPNDDAHFAEALCLMLPYKNELEDLFAETENVLREHWESVLKLADALEAEGLVETGIENYLPARIESWPPSPRSKRPVTQQ